MEVNVAIYSHVQLYAESICKLLEEDEEINVLGISDGNGHFESLLEKSPDIIVTDTADCMNILKLDFSPEKQKVLLICDKKRPFQGSDLKLMIIDGLCGLLTKDSDGQMLRKAVKKINDGELWIDRQTLKEAFSKKEKERRVVHLTKKETETLECICKGLTNKEIANKLNVCEQTVKSHCNHLFNKFGVSSRYKLAICESVKNFV